MTCEICNVNDITMTHWDSPIGHVAMISTCDDCDSLVENARTSTGRLTLTAVRRLIKKGKAA